MRWWCHHVRTTWSGGRLNSKLPVAKRTNVLAVSVFILDRFKQDHVNNISRSFNWKPTHQHPAPRSRAECWVTAKRKDIITSLTRHHPHVRPILRLWAVCVTLPRPANSLWSRRSALRPGSCGWSCRFRRLSGESARLLVQALVISRLDYSNSLVAWLPKYCPQSLSTCVPSHSGHCLSPRCDDLSLFSAQFGLFRPCWLSRGEVTFASLSKAAHRLIFPSCLKKSSLQEALSAPSLMPYSSLKHTSASFNISLPLSPKKQISSLAFNSEFLSGLYLFA